MTLRILTVLENAVIDLCQGQALDLAMSREVNGASGSSTGREVNLTTGRYLEMVRGKTAALFGAACEVGAICAGVDSGRGDLAREFYAQVKCK